ncbi:hypothetical protein FOA52_007555 [Chlamydomonas sp. UWO 241]|nr:hypothetical protein FOA52_007555 [Chlamydomonas sp. UWO 241]
MLMAMAQPGVAAAAVLPKPADSTSSSCDDTVVQRSDQAQTFTASAAVDATGLPGACDWLPNAQAAVSAPEAAPASDAMHRHLNCGLCTQLIASSLVLSCGHAYCGACLFEHVNEKPSCPTCQVGLRAIPVRCLALDGVAESVAASLPAGGTSYAVRVEDGRSAANKLNKMLWWLQPAAIPALGDSSSGGAMVGASGGQQQQQLAQTLSLPQAGYHGGHQQQQVLSQVSNRAPIGGLLSGLAGRAHSVTGAFGRAATAEDFTVRSSHNSFTSVHSGHGLGMASDGGSGGLGGAFSGGSFCGGAASNRGNGRHQQQQQQAAAAQQHLSQLAAAHQQQQQHVQAHLMAQQHLMAAQQAQQHQHQHQVYAPRQARHSMPSDSRPMFGAPGPLNAPGPHGMSGGGGGGLNDMELANHLAVLGLGGLGGGNPHQALQQQQQAQQHQHQMPFLGGGGSSGGWDGAGGQTGPDEHNAHLANLQAQLQLQHLLQNMGYMG